MRRELTFATGIPEIMCIFYIFYSILGVECQFINGSGLIKVQMITYCIAGLINIPFSIFLGVHMELGSLGIRLASTIIVFVQIIILGINLKTIISKYEKQSIIWYFIKIEFETS